MKYEDLSQINDSIERININGKPYATVPARMQGFRKLFPDGRIVTEILTMDNENVVMKTTVMDESGNVLATGHAQESRNASNVNKTSYIENCETSAVGRALGMIGIGSDKSMASAEEVRRAIAQQEGRVPTEETINEKIGAEEIEKIRAEMERTGLALEKFLGMFEIDRLEDLTNAQYYVAMRKFEKTSDARKDS